MAKSDLKERLNRQIDSRVNKMILIFFIILILACIVFVFLVPTIYNYICKTRVYDDFADQISEDILNANICVVRITTEEDPDDPDVGKTVCSDGASGVIFDKQGDTYYALTAYHVALSLKNELYVLEHDMPTYMAMKEQEGEAITLSQYREKLPCAKVELWDQCHDLAVISFQSTHKLSVLSLVDDDSLYLNDRIAIIGNTDGNRDMISYGEVLSEETEPFRTNGDISGAPVLWHNAYMITGSSGGPVINEKMQIVGINIGISRDFLGNFRCGAFVPLAEFKETIEKWAKERTQDPAE